jgi:hypothetical protein
MTNKLSEDEIRFEQTLTGIGLFCGQTCRTKDIIDEKKKKIPLSEGICMALLPAVSKKSLPLNSNQPTASASIYVQSQYLDIVNE